MTAISAKAKARSFATGHLPRLALILFGFSTSFKLAHANLATVLLLLATIVDWRNAKDVLKLEPYLWIYVLFLIYLVSSALYFTSYGSLVGSPPAWTDTWRYSRDLFLPGLLVGYWIYKDPNSLKWLLAAFLLGYLLLVVDGLPESRISMLLDGVGRATFGSPATLFGFWSFLVMLTSWLLLFAGRELFPASKKLNVALIILASVSFFVSAVGLVLSQARAAWLVAIAAFPLYMFGFTLNWYLKRKEYKRRQIFVGVLTLLFMVATAIWSYDIVKTRMADVRADVPKAFEFDWDATGANGLGYRLHMYLYGAELANEKPVFGWGVGSDELLLGMTDNAVLNKDRFGHFHNEPLNFLVEIGLFGLLLYLLALVVPIWYAKEALSSCQPWRRSYGVFVIAYLGSFLVYSVADMPATSGKGRAFLGMAVALGVWLKLESRKMERHSTGLN